MDGKKKMDEEIMDEEIIHFVVSGSKWREGA